MRPGTTIVLGILLVMILLAATIQLVFLSH
jgi:hypothetical protein